MSRYSHLQAALGDELLAKVRAAKVLVVGAGGIGCELLKNLVLTGFEDLEVIDLDTIDVSNLNRQFLFRPHHVGKPKAVVAREAVLAFNPAAKIVAYHANIKEPRFGLAYFQRFTLVINALDNAAARRHVNRLCLSADVHLVEAGTTGYKGQAYVIKKGATECYECSPAPPATTTYPVCTIRSTPDKPVHCVVYAKELFKLLLGAAESSYLFDAAEAGSGGGGDEAAGAGSDARRGSEYMHVVRDAPKAATDADGSGGVPSPDAVRAWAERLFDAVFHDELAERLRVAPETFKTAAVPPRPLRLADIMGGRVGAETDANAPAASGIKDQRVLSLRESAALFLASLCGYYTDAASRAALGALEFSKDAPRDLDFVTAATNLRAYTFGIPCQSRWDVKSIAGNIIPAIATTNAIVAGLEVIEAVKIVRGDDVGATGALTWVNPTPPEGGVGGVRKLLSASKPFPPNPSCYVCGTSRVTVFVDVTTTTLRTVMEKVLKGALSFVEPHVYTDGGLDFTDEWLEGEETEAEWKARLALLDRVLTELPGGGLGAVDGEVHATVDDEAQSMQVHVTVLHRPAAEFDQDKHPQLWEVAGDVGAAAAAASKAAAAAAAAASSSAAAAAPAPAPAAAGQKRGRDEGVSKVGTDGVVELLDSDDEGGGASSSAPAAKKAKSDGGAPAAPAASSAAAPAAAAVDLTLDSDSD